MLSVFVLCVAVAVATAQSPKEVQLIANYSHKDLNDIMNDPAKVKAIVDCVVEVGDCSEPLARPMHRNVKAWVDTMKICSNCSAQERVKIQFIVSQLILNHMDQYKRIDRHYRAKP
ncbi:uncharacterized protein [Procambarus clarkii]|uniref:uncharacterized protein n=1 Tax=Procambarus clarkii TaxID=6728 RepID=UPI001E671747|nr:uncharacterized protein LOC123760550 [Procambarus clarkii]